jgi:cytochrome P450
MAMVFGFNDEDAYGFDRHFGAVIGAAGRGDTQLQATAVNNFKSFLFAKIEEERADLVKSIRRYDKDGRRFTEDECLGLMWSAAGGAIDTTKHAIGHLVRELGVNGRIRRTLIENPSMIPIAIEESLRLNPSSFIGSRYIAKPFTLRGAALEPGQRILTVLGFANRDETVFADPDEMQLDRPSARHVTFGYGIHQCVGMGLARLELKIAIEELLLRIPDFSLADPTARPTLRGGKMWAYDSLKISLPRGRRLAVL